MFCFFPTVILIWHLLFARSTTIDYIVFSLTAKRVQYRKLSNPPGKDTKDQRWRNLVSVRPCSKNIYYSSRN